MEHPSDPFEVTSTCGGKWLVIALASATNAGSTLLEKQSLRIWLLT